MSIAGLPAGHTSTSYSVPLTSGRQVRTGAEVIVLSRGASRIGAPGSPSFEAYARTNGAGSAKAAIASTIARPLPARRLPKVRGAYRPIPPEQGPPFGF